ncbi:hypothetical protein FHS85_003470 [Rhodoligotrophos appendicifer]|uniref:hypothetical protein n=1 Tax=Rhodoligotrophos appendicifer TaxID=987056 RepID=UPI00118503C7|nr:hypothetical protein [Rhodoligotrophos appendicifer]
MIRRPQYATALALAASVFTASLWGLSTEPADAQSSWRRYSDQRLGISIEVPREGFIDVSGETQGEGIDLKAVDGTGEISVYSAALTSLSFKAFRQQLIKGAEDRGLDVTYRDGGQSWFVFSGLLDDHILYYKVLLKTVCGVPTAQQFHLRYPREKKRDYDAIVERMERTLARSPQVRCS